MKSRNIITILGFCFFMIGVVSLIVNLLGLTFTLTDWLNPIIGKTPSFFAKIILAVMGLIMTIAANERKEEYDEYFDGDKY